MIINDYNYKFIYCNYKLQVLQQQRTTLWAWHLVDKDTDYFHVIPHVATSVCAKHNPQLFAEWCTAVKHDTTLVLYFSNKTHLPCLDSLE